MSLKLEIETWVSALARYDNNEYQDALADFDKICDTSRILFNMGVIHATLGEHEKAVECYQRAIRLDQYLAVAYFQQGVSNFLLGDFEEALANFNDALLYLRVLFNRGLCYIYLQQRDAGMRDLSYAAKEKIVEDHDVIDDAIREEAQGYTVFSIPVGVLYRPNEAKVRNLKAKDYLGKARLVAASDRSNAFIGFAGSIIKKMEVKDDRPANKISFAATNLVKSDIQSRRQQSEPLANRNVFPPTPPFENDRLSRGSSVRNGSRPMPAKLTIQAQGSNRKYEKAPSPIEGRATGSAATSSAMAQGSSRREILLGQRRLTGRIDEVDEVDTADLYDMYQGGDTNRRTSRDSRRPSLRPIGQPPYRGYDEVSDYDDGSLDDAEFEMVSGDRRRQGSRPESRAPCHLPEIRKIRVKVYGPDVRYIMIGTAIEYPDFVDKIKDKFAMKRRFKIKIKDEDMPDGDMITVGDQDDLEMAVQSSISLAKRQGQDVAKLEIWIFDL